MKADHLFSDWLNNNVGFDAELTRGKSIIEILEDHRILIEMHEGIIQYGETKIGVKLSFGNIIVCGCRLEMSQMTKEKLLITGQINALEFQRR